LHRIVDDLPEGDLPAVQRVLEALKATADPVGRALASAPADDEPDEDDFDGGLSEARRQAQSGQHLSHAEAKRELGLESATGMT